MLWQYITHTIGTTTHCVTSPQNGVRQRSIFQIQWNPQVIPFSRHVRKELSSLQAGLGLIGIRELVPKRHAAFVHCARAACSFLQILPGSQIPTPQCYYTVVMAFRGREKKSCTPLFAQSKSGMPLGLKLSNELELNHSTLYPSAIICDLRGMIPMFNERNMKRWG